MIAEGDTPQLSTFLEDVSYGDISGLGDDAVDPHLERALHMAQYSTQYLRGCQQVLQSRLDLMQSAMCVFAEEEEALDLELAKMR